MEKLTRLRRPTACWEIDPYFLRSIYIEHRFGCYSKRVHVLKCVLLQYMADGIN